MDEHQKGQSDAQEHQDQAKAEKEAGRVHNYLRPERSERRRAQSKGASTTGLILRQAQDAFDPPLSASNY